MEKDKQITKLEQKYLVLKWDDINNLYPHHKAQLENITKMIDIKRHLINKPDNDYVVLNQDDEIDLTWLSCELNDLDDSTSRKAFVKDISVTLVNSILIAKTTADTKMKAAIHKLGEIEKKIIRHPGETRY